MNPATILFLAANPPSTSPLALDEEVRAIEEAIRASRDRERLSLVSKWATRVEDLQPNLLQHRPAVVHLSCHGNARGGVLLHNEEGTRAVISPAAMAGLFRALGEGVRLVLFNACDSIAQAEAVAQEVGCAIGMTDEIADVSARIFARSFYGAVGFGRSVGDAFEIARNALDLANAPGSELVRLVTRPGVDPRTVYVPGFTEIGRRIAILGATDEEDLVAWIKKLRMHLVPIARSRKFEVWDPSMIDESALVAEEEEKGYAKAAVIVVLASSSLLADEGFLTKRLPWLIERAREARVRIFTLIVSACDLASTPLGEYGAFNKPPKKPLDRLTSGEVNEYLAEASKKIAGAIPSTR